MGFLRLLWGHRHHVAVEIGDDHASHSAAWIETTKFFAPHDRKNPVSRASEASR
jgi:hypothetical protein